MFKSDEEAAEETGDSEAEDEVDSQGEGSVEDDIDDGEVTDVEEDDGNGDEEEKFPEGRPGTGERRGEREAEETEDKAANCCCEMGCAYGLRPGYDTP